MKLDHERLDVYKEVTVYEYVKEYEYGGEGGPAAPADAVPHQLLHATAGTGRFCRIAAAPPPRRA